jgi:hypothetical protein
VMTARKTSTTGEQVRRWTLRWPKEVLAIAET